MDKPVLSVWTNQQLPEAVERALGEGIVPHRLVISRVRGGNLSAPGADASLDAADIAFGQPHPEQVIGLPKLKWVQLTTAGYTRFDRADVRDALRKRQGQLTNSSTVFAEPCAQHALAMILAFSRQLPASLANQLGPHAWPQPAIRRASQLLHGQTVLIFGFGAIARRLVELLAPFHLHLTALRRHVRGDELVNVLPISAAEPLLATADHVVNILPATAETAGYFSQDRLALLKPGAYFYNIGRGTTVDQGALIQALQAERLAGAYLDVLEPEPLPAEHPLWTTRNCYLTPHTAGGFSDEFVALVQHFLANFKRFNAGQALLDRVF